MRLRNRIALSLIALLVIPIIPTAWFINSHLAATVSENLLEDMDFALEEVAYSYHTHLQTIQANLKLFSTSSLLESYLNIKDADTRYSTMQMPLLNLFSTYGEAYPDYYEIRILLPNGEEDARYTQSDLVNNIHENEIDSTWFQKMKSLRDGTFFDVIRNPDNGQIAFITGHSLQTFTHPGDMDPTFSELGGYLVLTIRPQFLEHLTTTLHPNEHIFLFVTDIQGNILFHGNQQDSLPATLPALLFHSLITQTNRIPDILLGEKTYRLQGKPLGNQLWVFAALDEKALFQATLMVSSLVYALALVMSILLFGGLFYTLRRLFLNPLTQISQAAEKLGKGAYDVRLDETSSIDEFNRLSHTFNLMVSDLEVLYRHIEKQNRDLEDRVTQRTLELQATNQELGHKITELEQTRQQLIAATATAEQANQAKSTFLASMSHEIRTPMNGVLGMLESLIHSGLTSRQKQMADIAIQSADSLLHLINDILDLSKVEAGRIELEKIAFDLPTLVEGVLMILATRAMAKRLELHAILHEPIPTGLVGDPTRLRQVLMNLIGNAIKFTEHGSVTLEVSLTSQHGGEGEFRFQVQDTGIGIAPQNLAKLFRPFSQADGSITRRYGGTGLGLVISARLVECMGSTIQVKSTLGQGSQFYFSVTLPFNNTHWLEATLPLSGHKVAVDARPESHLAWLTPLLQAWGAQVHPIDQQIPTGSFASDFLIVKLQGENPDETQADRLNWQPIRTAHPTFTIEICPTSISPDPSLMTPNEFLLPWPVVDFRIPETVLALLTGQLLDRPMTPIPQRQLLFTGHVLVAEDNIVNQMVIQQMLTDLGVSHDLADNGRKAMDLSSVQSYDLILMDMQMPEMDGLEATRQIRIREQNHPQVPIIALTANALDQDRHICLNAGMNDFLSKPIRLQVLAEMLAKWLKPAPASPEIAKPSKPNPPPVAKSVSHIDWEVFHEVRVLMEDEFEDMLHGFICDTTERMEQLRGLIEAGRITDVRSKAHQLKGAGRTFGAVRFALFCGDLQTIAEQGSLASAPLKLIEMETEFQHTALELQKEMTKWTKS